MKKYRKFLIIVLLILYMLFLGLNKYKESPRYLIRHTVMRYEQDFSLPVFTTSVRFDYDWETGNYTGKFMIGEKSAQRLNTKLKAARRRCLEANPRQGGKGSNAWALNTTHVVDMLKEDTECDMIFPEKWMGEENADILCYYVTNSDYQEGITEEYTKPGEEKFDNYIVIFKNNRGNYYLCIKRTDYSDWDGTQGG